MSSQLITAAFKITNFYKMQILRMFIWTLSGGNSATSSPQESTKPTKAFTFRRTDGSGLFGAVTNDAGANTLGLDRDYTIIREKFMAECDHIPGKKSFLFLQWNWVKGLLLFAKHLHF